MGLLESESVDTKETATEISVDSEQYQSKQVKQELELGQVYENEPEIDSCAVTRSS